MAPLRSLQPQVQAANDTTFDRRKQQPDAGTHTSASCDDRLRLNSQRPRNWPTEICYLDQPIVSSYLTEQQRRWLRHRPQPQDTDTGGNAKDALITVQLSLPCDCTDRIVEIKSIDEKRHPACGQHGLFATRDLGPDDLIIPYIGYVHSSTASERQQHELVQQRQEHESILLQAELAGVSHDKTTKATSIDVIGSWDTSDYDLNLHRDEDIELAIDAANIGNEARFCNDYRGVPAPALSTTDRTSQQWDRRSKRSAKSWKTTPFTTFDTREDQEPHIPTDQPMAIPNAEFRDVWFEWSQPNTKTETTRNNNATHSPDHQSHENRSSFSAHTPLSPTKPPRPPSQTQKQARRQQRRNKSGMRGVAIFVLPAGKSGKRKHGIKAGEEVLVSYGKGFWAHHGTQPAILEPKTVAP